METLIEAVNPTVFVSAGVLILLMSLIPEPARAKFNAIFVGGAAAAYLNGGFGLWEFAYILYGTVVAFKGLDSYKWIGVAWVSHTLWDVAHHFYGNPIWHWSETSAAGCAVFDLVFAAWFFAGAPSPFDRYYRRRIDKAANNLGNKNVA